MLQDQYAAADRIDALYLALRGLVETITDPASSAEMLRVAIAIARGELESS
jgi:hypothetical protein